MKKSLTNFAKWLVVLLPTLLSYSYSRSQSDTKGAANQIVVSVPGIEYDDPDLALLKENLQKIKNVSALKPGYKAGTAIITLTYNSSASALWEELPNTAKELFKVTGMEDTHIELQSKNAANKNTASGSNTASADDEDCKTCYINLCRYDGLKTFQGVVYKQINKDDGTYYYNCDNGNVTVKQVIRNEYGVTTNITNDTIIMSQVPVGTQWGVSSYGTSVLGLTVNHSTAYTLIAKGLKLEANGVTYNDVIEINYRKIAKDFISGDQSVNENNYYARGVGLIKTEKTDINSNAAAGGNGDTNDYGVKGSIDPTLVGLWKYEKGGNVSTYNFNADGTWTNAITGNAKCLWRVHGDSLQIYCVGNSFIYHYLLQKKNDPATGKPELIIAGYTYVAMGNQPAWKQN